MTSRTSVVTQDAPIHSLIEQASTLARELQKADRKALDRLREEAQQLIGTLDTSYPRESIIQRVLGLVRNLSESGPADIECLRRRAKGLDSGTVRHRQRGGSASTREAYDWTMDMFRAVESAIPRETLVKDFVARYRRERNVTDSERHDGPWLFMFETHTEQGRLVGVDPLVGAGVHSEAFEQRCRDFLPHWEEDPFLTAVLRDQQDIDTWYALLFGGTPLFDALLDIKRRMRGEPDYWVNAVVLPGDARYETRGIFVLYRNVGDPLRSEPPSGVRQDMRVLMFLGLAWRQLEHQVRALARVSEADRRDMINLIAPGLLHHEIGFNMRTAYGQAYEQFHLLKRLASETGNPDMELAARYAHGIARLVLDLYRITDAFNNLDKRARVEDSDLDQVFGSLKLLLHHRLGHAYTELIWDEGKFKDQVLHTDVVLLSQALINIVNNALNALTDSKIPPPRSIRADLEHADEARLALIMVNNGPPVPAEEAHYIFRRGYTTRPQGHGQGLYLARLVAHYLGGDLDLMETSALPEGFNVGFRFTFNRRIPAEQGVARETD